MTEREVTKMYWGILDKDGVGRLGIVEESEGSYCTFYSVDCINRNLQPKNVFLHRITPMEDYHPQAILDMIDFALDNNDEERFKELTDMWKQWTKIHIEE